MLIKSRILLVFLCAAWFSLAACNGAEDANTARIAVASNFQTAMAALETDFEASSVYQIDTVYGSTGKLYAQITQGAPFEAFLAADQSRPERLETDGAAVHGSRFTYARGQLALWAPSKDEVSAAFLQAGDFSRLALANPDLAPYGLAAAETLTALGAFETTAAQHVLGESVGQAFAFVSTGNASVGFVSYAQILSLPKDQVGGLWLPPPALYSPIDQDFVLLNRGARNAAAIGFMNYLQTPGAKEIIARYGYQTP